MKARVTIFFKDSVFDPQGNTIANSLQRIGFRKVKSVRMGRVIDVELEEVSREVARADISQMCEKLLANPVIESYRCDFPDEKKRE